MMAVGDDRDGGRIGDEEGGGLGEIELRSEARRVNRNGLGRGL